MMDPTANLGPEFQMWAVFAIILAALAGYARERIPMEVTSFGAIAALLLLFQIAPLTEDPDRLSPERILQGFANPALITVCALLVMGEGIARTGLLDRLARLVLDAGGRHGWIVMTVVLGVVLAISGFMNNIPVVVIFIPILRAIADRFELHVGKVMIPLTYAAVLGGMTTLVGSSTNLLVNGALGDLGLPTFGFFDFSILGLILALTGLVYILAIVPRLLPERAGMTESTMKAAGMHFIAQLTVPEGSKLIGQTAPAGFFPGLAGVTVRMVQRGEDAILPPFEDTSLQTEDVIVVAGTRARLIELMAANPGQLFPSLGDDGQALENDEEPWRDGEQVLAEVMVTPGSRLVGHTLTRIKFRYRTGCIVLGIQRRARMLRSRLTDIHLEAGDVLLAQGRPEDVAALRNSRDVLLIDWSRQTLPSPRKWIHASAVFIASLALAASGLLPIVVSTLCGAVAMVAFGVLNLSQAVRAVDPKVVATIGVSLALGLAMWETGGADFVAAHFVELMHGAGAAITLSAFFLLLAALSNVISTKTTAVLFTPIAVDIALRLEAPVEAFAVAVVFAANCSFASPIGYQTNLLVMGPGHYRFIDFTRAGVPLILLLWVVFSLLAPWFYGL